MVLTLKSSHSRSLGHVFRKLLSGAVQKDENDEEDDRGKKFHVPSIRNMVLLPLIHEPGFSFSEFAFVQQPIRTCFPDRMAEPSQQKRTCPLDAGICSLSNLLKVLVPGVTNDAIVELPIPLWLNLKFCESLLDL